MIATMALRASATAARIGAPERAGLLMAANGPYHQAARRQVRGIPFGNVLLAGATSTVHATAAALPMHLSEQFVAPRAFGPGATPEERRTRRIAALAGSLGAVALGVVAQRGLNHSGRHGQAGTELARVLATEVAIAGAAGTIVLTSDHLLGERARTRLNRPSTAVTVGALIAAGQSRLLRRAAALVTLPSDPYSHSRPR